MGKEKKRQYTRKDFENLRIVAAIFTLLYFILDNFVNIANIIGVNEIPDNILIVGGVWWFLLPVIVLISWYMCIERYLSYEMHGKECNIQERMNIHGKILAIIISGVVVWWAACGLLSFWGACDEYVEHLYICMAIKIAILVAWGCCWIWLIQLYFKKKPVDEPKVRNGIFLIQLVLLLGGTVIGTMYVDKQLDDAYWERFSDNMEEYYENQELRQ